MAAFQRQLLEAIILGTLILCWASLAWSRTLSPQGSMAERHEQWMTAYGRSYADDAEKAMRLSIFKQNMQFIESFNRNSTTTYKLGPNEFLDMTNEEFMASMTGLKMSSDQLKSFQSSTFNYEDVSDVPSTMDWREKGAVTPVKYQNSCGTYVQFLHVTDY